MISKDDGTCDESLGGIDEGVHLHDAVLPDVAKVVRLAFHDCIGENGCDGCINYHNPLNEGLPDLIKELEDLRIPASL